jgi:hypothetical protein
MSEYRGMNSVGGYYAHSTQTTDKSDWQSLRGHLIGAGKLAARYSSDFGGDRIAEVAGLLHDLGKYTREFQLRLQGKFPRMDHATWGARIALQTHRPTLLASTTQMATVGGGPPIGAIGAMRHTEGYSETIARIAGRNLRIRTARFRQMALIRRQSGGRESLTNRVVMREGGSSGTGNGSGGSTSGNGSGNTSGGGSGGGPGGSAFQVFVWIITQQIETGCF